MDAKITLPEAMDEKERTNSQSLYPNEDFVSGLGEYFSAARELVRRFENSVGMCPPGSALVRAAVDWRRAGMVGGIPESGLQELYRVYFHQLRPLENITESTYRRELDFV